MARKQTRKKITKTPNGSKNWLRYFLIVLLVVLALVALNWKPQAKDSDEIEITSRVKVPSVTIALTQDSNPTAKRVESEPIDDATTRTATQLVSDYLSGYESNDVIYDNQLTDYVIHSVSGRKTATQLLIEVNYSVKPAVYNSFWYSGTGSISADGWIHNKYGCAVVNMVDGSYTKIDSLGTGCNFAQ